jgi:phenylpyruvate tautomerase PptA (4-oxalocrotonate tautomerase family)
MQILPFKCLVNGVIDARQRSAVEHSVTEVFARHLPQVRLAAVEFVEVERGLWFTAGKPSQASMLLGSVPRGTEQSVRVALMDALAHRFSEITGAPYHDVMVVAADARE